MKLKALFISFIALLITACGNSGAPVCSDSQVKEDIINIYRQKGSGKDTNDYEIRSIVTKERDEEAKWAACWVMLDGYSHKEEAGFEVELGVVAYRQEDGSLEYQMKNLRLGF